MKQIHSQIASKSVGKLLERKKSWFSALYLMTIESDLVRELDFEDLICGFAKKKTRKKNF